MRNDLPETCFSVLPGKGDLIILKRGEKGFYHSDRETGSKPENKRIADWYNQQQGITPAQIMAMQIGSMCGFDVPGADPQFYFDEAQYTASCPLLPDAVLYASDSLCGQAAGRVLQYQIAGEACFYLDPVSMPERVMGLHSNGIILADMVHGQPLVPVSAEWSSNGICSLHIAPGSFVSGEEKNAGYQIIAKVQVGPVEYALGGLGSKFPSFVTWERTPANDGDGPPNYYWGHYFDSREAAIRDFCDRAGEKYAMLAESRKPSIKAQLAAKPVSRDRPPTKPKEREVR